MATPLRLDLIRIIGIVLEGIFYGESHLGLLLVSLNFTPITGMFVTLLYDLTVILVKRAKERKRGICRQPIFPTSLILLVVITGVRIICFNILSILLIIELLQHLVGSLLEVIVALVPPRSASYCLVAGEFTHAEKYFMGVHNPFNITSAAFYIATLVISEWFLVRFWTFLSGLT